ncbi:BA14K family protein [Bartonella jaculi]|uniref:Lectin-like protein BA14k n=1 Tax=Bartonella jaculi TaxID=686226 RepID=A0ABP9N6M7_9HYPH
MKKVTKLAVLSVMSTVTVLMPLDTTLADMTWAHGDYISREIDRKIERMNKEINDNMKKIEMQTRFSSSNFNHHFDNGSTRLVSTKNPSHNHHYHVDHRRREDNYHHVERETRRYVERKTITHHHINVNRDNSGDALAAGIIGLAAGAILGNVLKKPEQPQVIYQVAPQQRVVYQEVPQIVYQQVPQEQIVYEVQQTATYKPLQQSEASAWLNYCKKKYRSFNPKTGTFRDRNGLEHFCYAPVY